MGLYETPPARGGGFALSLLEPKKSGPKLIPVDCNIISHSSTGGKRSCPVAINRFPEETQFAVVATYPEDPAAAEYRRA